jgi:hypothetical protein
MRRAILLLSVMFVMVAPSGCAWLRRELGAGKPAHAEPTPEQRRQRYVDAHPELSAEVRQAILEGALREGMSTEHVSASLGHPRSRAAMTGSTPEQGDEEWVFEDVVYGTKTSFEGGGSDRTRILSGVRDTRVRFSSGAVVGVDDLGYITRDELVASCHAGAMKACERVDELDARAASGPPG